MVFDVSFFFKGGGGGSVAKSYLNTIGGINSIDIFIKKKPSQNNV